MNDEEYKKWASALDRVPAVNSKNAFLPLEQNSKGGAMCGSSKTITAEYPDYWYVLSDEIR